MGGREEGSGSRLILGGSGKRRDGDQMIGISGIYTEKIILLSLISDQERKKIKRWNGGNLQRNTTPE